VFSNLLSNALKYSGGDLMISLKEPCVITFSNTADGLTQTQVEKLFDRFYTVENANKSTGLGLSIARTLVEQMSGGIRQAGLALLLVVALMMVISAALIANTVRLGLYSNRITIHTMQLVGADRRFIARPYVRRSVAQGLVAALIALALIALAVFLVWKSHPDIYEIFTVPAFVGTAVTVIATGVILCWLCTNAVVARITRLDNDELYG
jgi:cell division protein FtsX